MNKLAHYLNQHIVGEVITEPSVRARYATDDGPIEMLPEMVVYPRNTQDVRKLLRFVWQLAEKGHSLPVTARGAGANNVGAAVGDGVVVALAPHMNTVFEYDAKQRLVRLQPGASTDAVANALKLQGTAIAPMQDVVGTVGGWLAHSSRKRTREIVDKLEVVLANGDVLQTGKISKRELNKLKGKQGFIADVYRDLDALLEDNADTIASLSEHDSSGYTALTEVKKKDGSLDLTPLFLGSDGTLGIISEMILKTEFTSDTRSAVAGAFEDVNQVRDAIDDIAKVQPTSVEYYDAGLIAAAKDAGKKLSIVERGETLLVAYIDVIGDRAQARKVKKLRKIMQKYGGKVTSTNDFESSELLDIKTIPYLSGTDNKGASSLAILDGAYVPLERFDEFANGVAELSTKLRVDLPLIGYPIDNEWSLRPLLNIKTVGGKQAVFKLIDSYATLVVKCGGHLAGAQAEGRIQTLATVKHQTGAERELYKKLKNIFDPHGILNGDVKQHVDVKSLAKQLRSSYTMRDPLS